MFKKILLIILLILLIALIAFVVIVGGGGQLFQGALYNLRPIYQECRIESGSYQSNNASDCENFMEKLKNGEFPDGEYTIFAKYTDKQMPQNIIPVTISENGKKAECTFLENGYEPSISVFPVSDPLNTQTLKTEQEIPAYSQGTVVQINYKKNGQNYAYDTNICEKGFNATLYDDQQKAMGMALLDHNGFINSRPLVNEVLINDIPYYTDQSGNIVREFSAGNIYTALNVAPDIRFKMTIPCSHEKVSVFIPTMETSSDLDIPFQGINPNYMKACGSKLYLSLQNTNRADDIQIIDDLGLGGAETLPLYHLKLSQIARVTDTNTKFPISFKVSLHLRDRSDENEVITLGTGLLTVNNYDATLSSSYQNGTIQETNATGDNTVVIRETSATPDTTGGAVKPKVKRSAN